MPPHGYEVSRQWRAMIKDLGAEPADVLRHAGLPDDLFGRAAARLAPAEYFRLWRSLERVMGDTSLPITLCSALKSDVFSPPLFAALCSPDLLTAMRRLSQYKPLIAPMRLEVCEVGAHVTLDIAWLEDDPPPPLTLVMMELLFFVALARMGTRERIEPVRVITTALPAEAEADAYAQHLGVRMRRGKVHQLWFREADALSPFLTSDEGMWAVFEPELRRRLDALDATATTTERVRAALLEGLPSGLVTMDAIAHRLGTTKRTLQRHLGAEQTSYQQVLQRTRESLAQHYLRKTQLAAAEISFLLGFSEPNSFFRAFHRWTGRTPDHVRQAP
jgi:AraC-like DNA-binding protein